jgi:GTPase SAR1 family protein
MYVTQLLRLALTVASVIALLVCFTASDKFPHKTRPYVAVFAIVWLEGYFIQEWRMGSGASISRDFSFAMLLIIPAISIGFAFLHPYVSAMRYYHKWYKPQFEAAQREAEEKLSKNVAADFYLMPDMVVVFERLARALYTEDGPSNMLPGPPEFRFTWAASYYENYQQSLGIPGQDIRPGQSWYAAREVFFEFNRHINPIGMFNVPVIELEPHPIILLRSVIGRLSTDHYRTIHIGDTLRHQYAANVTWYANKKFESEIDYVRAHVKGTALEEVFELRTFVSVPPDVREAHTLIVGGSGAGKTQLLERLIVDDLNNNRAVVVLDSKPELINRIARLADPAKVVYVDPRSKPALNIFETRGELTHERVNEMASNMRYFFRSLLGDELSQQMNTLFVPLLHIALRVPGCTLSQLRQIVRDPTAYPEALAQVPPTIREFIEQDYMAKGTGQSGYETTKQSVRTRLQGIINEITLDEMFSAPRNMVDLDHQFANGGVVLISTDAPYLKDNSPIFAKFWISQILNAGLRRGSDQTKKKPQVRVYIDECGPYVDERLKTILQTLRSYDVNVTMAFLNSDDMRPHVSVFEGTAVKFFSDVTDTDARLFATSMKTTAEFILRHGRAKYYGRFAFYYRGLPRAITAEFPFGEYNKNLKSMSAFQALKQRNAELLGYRPQATPQNSEPYRSVPPSRVEDLPTSEGERQDRPEVGAPGKPPPIKKVVVPPPKQDTRDPNKAPKRRKSNPPDESGSKPTDKW